MIRNISILLILAFAFSQPESDRCDPVSECASDCGTCCMGNGSSFTTYSSDACDSAGGIAFYVCEDEIICDSYNGTVTDIDGNVYETVQIGDQLWMAENMKVTHYRNGDEIPTGHTQDDWANLTEGAFSLYGTTLDIYGYLYNGYAANDDRGICPEDWHVSTIDDMTILVDYLGGENIAGGKLKECTEDNCPESEYWWSPNEGATNESGFEAVPGGYRFAGQSNLGFFNKGNTAYLWYGESCSTSIDWGGYYSLRWYEANISLYSECQASLRYGYSIRCLADITGEIFETGCTDPEACNYDETANVDDGSCEYEVDCAGECSGDAEVDCAGECGGTAEMDECGECDGSGILDGECDCNGNVLDACGICGGDGSSCVLLVPAEYSTIQEAINAASEGDSVLVSAGSYVENITWPETNGIKLIGSGVDDCFIDGGGIDSLRSVIRFEEDLGGIIDSTTLITGFTIQNGYAQGDYPNDYGGGMCLRYSSPTLNSLTFSSNTAIYNGGGMSLYYSSPTLMDVTFSNNTSDAAGGMDLFRSNPTLTDVTFIDNTAESSGGGMKVSSDSSPTLTEVIFSDNTAGWGGGMHLSQSNPTLMGVTFSNNTASSGGGIYSQSSSSSTLTDVTFSNNTAPSGGGIRLANSSSTLTNVTFSSNTGGVFNGGGILLTNASSAVMTNSILWGNSTYEINAQSSTINISYSNIQGGEAEISTYANGTLYWGDGNIDADPLFTDPDNGDFTLQSSSPCIDAGDPDSEIDPDGTVADMGAYPFFHIWGCIDDEACNYDEDANTDDGSCLVFDICGNCDDDLENDDDCLTWPEEIIGNWVYKGNDIFDSDCQENLGNICLDYFDATQCDENPICIWNNDNAICELQVPYDNIDTTLYSAFISVSEDGYYDFIYTDLSLNILYIWRAEWGVNNQNQICVKDVAFEGWHASYYWEQEESLMLYTNEYGDVSIIDDISYCIMETWERVEGCTDILAINYYNLASIDDGSCEYHYTIELHEGANLVSFWALPDDNSLDSMFIDLDGIITGVIGEGTAAVPNDLLGWIGSLSEISCTSGYWITVSEDVIWDIIATELCPCDIVYTIHAGSNLVSWPSSNSCSVGDAIPDDYEPYITGIIGEGVATYPNETFGWVGSLVSFQSTKGYWLGSDTDMYYNWDACSCSGSFSRIATDDNKTNSEYFNQSTKQAFYFIEDIENIEVNDWILAYYGEEVIGARQWTGSIIDVPTMGNDGSDLTKGYIEAGEVPSFKILRGDELIDLEGDIPAFENNQLYMVSSLTEAVALPETFSLDSAYPNPFNPTTTLSFAIPIDSEVSLSVYNLQGREVSSLIDGNMDAGYHSVVWNADSFSSGVYFVKMVAGEFVNTQKLMLVK